MARLAASVRKPGVLEFWDYFRAEYGADSGASRSRRTAAPTGRRSTLQGSLGGYSWRSYELSAYRGAEIQIRFWLISDNWVSYAGWYIDDSRPRPRGREGVLTPDGDAEAVGLTHRG